MSDNENGKELVVTKTAGRPKIIIDWVDFNKLCGLQCTLKEIAAWFGCSEDTIERRVEEEKLMNFAEYFGQKREKGIISLRRLQWISAENGSITMQIFLGKNYLSQSDQGIIKPKDKDNREIPTVIVHIDAPKKIEVIEGEDVKVEAVEDGEN